MLNEDPRPDDLPDGPTGYAALPPDYPPPSPSAGGSGGGMRGRSWQRAALAAVAVMAVVAAVVLAVWRIGSPTPAAQPRGPVTSSGPVTPSPSSMTPSPSSPAGQDYPAALADFYTQ